MGYRKLYRPAVPGRELRQACRTPTVFTVAAVIKVLSYRAERQTIEFLCCEALLIVMIRLISPDAPPPPSLFRPGMLRNIFISPKKAEGAQLDLMSVKLGRSASFSCSLARFGCR